MTKQVFAIIDTETAGSIGFPLIYDLGVTIVDINGNVLAEDNWLIREVFFKKSLMDNAFYGSKRPKYYEMIAENQIKVNTYKGAMYELNKLLQEHKVTVLCAYNANFDFRALSATTKLTKLDWKNGWKRNPMFWDSYDTLCIWGLCCETIYNTPEYIEEAHKNGWLTPKGNPLTNAEVGYKFVMSDTEFTECHTALSDTKIEAVLLIRALKTLIDYSEDGIPNPWQLVAKFNKKYQMEVENGGN